MANYSGWFVDGKLVRLANSGTDETAVRDHLAAVAGDKPHRYFEHSVQMKYNLVEWVRSHGLTDRDIVRSMAIAERSVRQVTPPMYMGWYIADGHLHIATYGLNRMAVIEKLADIAGNNVQTVLADGQQSLLWEWGKRQGLSEDQLVEDAEHASKRVKEVPRA